MGFFQEREKPVYLSLIGWLHKFWCLNLVGETNVIIPQKSVNCANRIVIVELWVSPQPQEPPETSKIQKSKYRTNNSEKLIFLLDWNCQKPINNIQITSWICSHVINLCILRGGVPSHKIWHKLKSEKMFFSIINKFFFPKMRV